MRESPLAAVAGEEEHVSRGVGPCYDVETVQRRIRSGQYIVPARVRRHMRALGWDEQRVVDCAGHLDARSFHKSLRHRERPGVWLDVYRPWLGEDRLYVKITVLEDDSTILILSFCMDGTAH